MIVVVAQLLVGDASSARRRVARVTVRPQLLKDFGGTLLADAYGGYDGIVLNQDLPPAGCWAQARRELVAAERTAPAVLGAIVELTDHLFALGSAPCQGAAAVSRSRR